MEPQPSFVEKAEAALPDQTSADPEYPLLMPLDEAPTPRPQDRHDPSLPADAFQSFRLGAERQSRQAAKNPASKAVRLILWGVASLVVIGFFALLVNIILPGPGGVRPALHTAQPQERSSANIQEHDLGHSGQAAPKEVGARR